MSDTVKSVKSEKKTKKKKEWSQDAAIYSALRRAYRSSPAMKECLESGKEVYYIESKKGKQLRRVRFLCVACGKKVSRKNIKADHIAPVVDPIDGNKLPNGSRDWNKQIDRLFVSAVGLQRMCSECHNEKSKAENALRRKIKKEKLNGC